jgi:hypothetical protein
MNKIVLPHTNERVDLDLLLAVCNELTQEWRDSPLSASSAPMPIYHSAQSLDARLQTNPEYAYSFDMACRRVSGQRNMMHATNVFFNNRANADWFQRVPFANGLFTVAGARRNVQCVQFTKQCMDHWESLPPKQREHAQIRAQALLNADVDDRVMDNTAGSDDLPISPVGLAAILNQASTNPPAVPEVIRQERRHEIVNALVAEIQDTPFEAIYRKKATGAAAVSGWDKRLQAYYWPSPLCGYEQTCAGLDKLTGTGATLAAASQEPGGWDADEEAMAVKFANDVFVWGGVPQDPATVTAANVLAVFVDALTDNRNSKALMNSGWTKVAAFATAHLENLDGGKPQVIWDSRVATSLIGRLNGILAAAGTHENARAIFPDIGTVPGRGGSRPRAFSMSWPIGYQRWATQICGSALVREIRDILNVQDSPYPPMPLGDGNTGRWTTRGVEMVLFMDGY